MMIRRSNFLVTLIFCFSFASPYTDIINSAHAEKSDTYKQNKSSQNRVYGKVVDTLDASGYTYAEVDTGEKKVWGAARITPLKIGDMIAFSTDMPMQNFHSKSLKRDFSVVYFVDRFITDKVIPAGNSTLGASPHANIKQKQTAKSIKGIKKVKGGHTIAEIYENKASLEGKTIRVRGQVTKFTASVMGKNWLHIRDSSGLQDLTITTDNKAAIDDIIVIEGKLGLDKDFKYGYVYPVIVEEAKIE